MPCASSRQAGISAKGFGEFFERLDRNSPTRGEDRRTNRKDEEKGSLGSRISHPRPAQPSTDHRSPRPGARAAGLSATPALSAEDWQALREMCGPQSSHLGPQVPPLPTVPPPPGPAPHRRRHRHQRRAPTPQAADADRDIAEATKALEANPGTSPRCNGAHAPIPRRASTRKPSPTMPRPASCGLPTPICTSAGAGPTTASPVRAGARRLRRSAPPRRPTTWPPATAAATPIARSSATRSAHRFRRIFRSGPTSFTPSTIAA